MMILGISAIGISYAGFTDEINIFGEATVATVDHEITDYSWTEVWKVWGDGAPDNEMMVLHYPAPTGQNPDPTDYPNYEQVSWSEINEGSGDYDIEFGFYNVFPLVPMHVDFTIKYTGTIPAKIYELDWNMLQENEPWMQYIDITGYMYNEDEEPVEEGYQLHTGDEVHVELWIEIAQQNELQGKHIEGEAWLKLIQWNEYTPPCDDGSGSSCDAPQIDSIDLESTESEESPDSWSGTEVPESAEGYIQVLPENPAYSYTFFNLGTGTSITNLAMDLHPYYLDTDSVPDGFYDTYWYNKGVYEGCDGTWEPYMWDIITGEEPMFYLSYDGSDYDLIDGLEYLQGDTEYLKVTNDYPEGSYQFIGTLTSPCGAQCMHEITMIFAGEYPNTIDSGTMIFAGSLTDNGDGSLSGTIPMVNEDDEELGDGIAGFDVYAKNGATAMYYGVGSYVSGTIVYHDAYTTAGGWGSFYDPDCADWYNYQLRLIDGEWYLEYNSNVGNDGDTTGASAAPMSGAMDWDKLYAYETGAGAYYPGMGTAADPGYALDNTYTGVSDGTASWDMDWSWGSEYIPLEYLGYTVSVEEPSTGQYIVTLTPAPMPWP